MQCSHILGHYYFQVDFPELINGPVSLKQDDPNLVRFVRQHHLNHPIDPANDVSSLEILVRA